MGEGGRDRYEKRGCIFVENYFSPCSRLEVLTL